MNNDHITSKIRHELIPHLIAIRDYQNIGRGWLVAGHKTIQNARDEYDSGYADIVHQRVESRDNGTGVFALFCIPRLKRAHVPDGYKFASAHEFPTKKSYITRGRR